MNGSAASIDQLLGAIAAGVEGIQSEVVVCPPFVFLAQVQEAIRNGAMLLGVQNINANPGGAFTGEVSTEMVAEFGCRFAIVGHSERRSYYGESDAVVAEKFKACLSANLTPILCVGETLEERDEEMTEQVVSRQLEAVLNAVGIDGFRQALIAYEPIWAIGTGVSATAAQAEEVHRVIRGQLSAKDSEVAEQIRILYGGSVKAANAAELFGQENVDGALVGGASLDAEEFTDICRSAG
jgi:triosephosphate isomerase|tara:strand:+ start:11057 stop:11773 length:717 start_codon:yes stop_codon:yes gene_type:complete